MASDSDYDLDNSPDEMETRKIIEAFKRRRLERDLDQSPEAVENRGLLAMLRARKAARAASSLPAPTAGSQPHTYPGVAALVMAHTLMAVADHDAEMRLWASDIEWGARSMIRLHLGREDDGVAN
jgi:hypothetical protein